MKGLVQGHTASKKGNKIMSETRSSLCIIGGVDLRKILGILLGTWYEINNIKLILYKKILALFRGHSLV